MTMPRRAARRVGVARRHRVAPAGEAAPFIRCLRDGLGVSVWPLS